MPILSLNSFWHHHLAPLVDAHHRLDPVAAHVRFAAGGSISFFAFLPMAIARGVDVFLNINTFLINQKYSIELCITLHELGWRMDLAYPLKMFFIIRYERYLTLICICPNTIIDGIIRKIMPLQGIFAAIKA